jgi:Bacterial membrane protein YfhO
MEMPRARAPLSWAFATVGLALVLYPGALLRGEAFFERDLHLDWYPRLAALQRCLGAGDWPLWEPGLGFGQPLLSDPSLQALYPPTWLALALPWGVAYTAFVLVHLFLAGFGASRLAARLGAGTAGAWTAGLAFVLSGPIQSSLNLWTHLAGTAWMPWVLLAVEAAVRRPGVGSTLRLAVALALQILAGSPDLCATTYGLALVVAGSLLCARRPGALQRGGDSLRRLVALGAALSLAAALTSMIWLPTAEAVSRSARRDLPEDARTAWSVPVLGLARLVAPLEPARVPFEPDLWRRLYDRPVPPLLHSVYLGIPLLGLAGAAVAGRRRRGRAIVWGLVGVLVVAYAMGPHGPVYGPLTEVLSPLKSLRFPSKALGAAALIASVLAGLGLRALGSTPHARPILAWATLLACGAATLLASRLGAALGWSPWLGLTFAALLMLPSTTLGPRLASTALTAIVVADLLAAHTGLNATVPASLLTETPAVLQLVRNDDGTRLFVWDYQSSTDTERLLGRPDPYRPAVTIPGLDSRVLDFVAQHQVLAGLTPAFFGVETSYDFDLRGLYPRDLNDLTYFRDYVKGTAVHTRLLQLGAVARVIALHERGLEDLRLERALPSLVGDPLRVFAVPNPQPRAWLVGRTQVADGEAAFRALGDASFDPRTEAIVASGAPLTDASALDGSVRWLERRADRQRLEATSSRSAVLVLADAHDPGWRASVDGEPATLLRANVAFRAVPVPAGRHTVELVYRPRRLLLGLVVAGVAAVVAAGMLVATRREPRAVR